MTPALTTALDLHQPVAVRMGQQPTDAEKDAMRVLNRIRASITDDNWPKKVAAFRSLFSLAQHDRQVPGPLLLPRQNLHMRLLAEEFDETGLAALGLSRASDPETQAAEFANFVDGILDLIYVGLGALCEAGFSPEQINRLMEEVHASNTTKVDDDGKPIYDEGGKVLKGTNYVKADIAGLIASFVAAGKEA